MTDSANMPGEEPDKLENPTEADDARRRFRQLIDEEASDHPPVEAAGREPREEAPAPHAEQADEEAQPLDLAADSPQEEEQAAGNGPESAAEGEEEPAALPARHPTGQPDLTGGWFMQPDPISSGSGTPPAGPEAGESEKAEKETGDPESQISDTRATPVSRRAATPPPPMLGDTPQRRAPAIGTRGMPLPKRVDEIDMDATRVSPAAYDRSGVERTIPPPAHPPKPPKAKRPKAQAPRRDWSRPLGQGMGCLLRMIILALFGGVIIALALGSFALYEYYQIAATLPSVDDLRLRTSQFETTRILDRNGNVLYEILDPNAGRRTYVPLARISPFMVAATVATEDKNFYSNPGFDPLAILRAFMQNFQSGEVASGASTITQQVARNLILSPEERGRQTYMRKVREALLAAEITRRYSKDEILELYINENNYGNLSYGVEAAAQTYFGTSAEKLTLAQSAFLAGLPQAPSVYDVYTNREGTMERFRTVLVLMFEASQDQGCISVSNNPQPVCVDEVAAAAANGELKDYEFRTPDVQFRYPHWVNFIRAQLEAQFDPQTIYRSGFTVFTTLDPDLQDAAEQIVAQQVNALADRHVTNGALVAIRPSNGEILAMVGSADFYNEDIDGQVNMAVAPRQPGSSIKPLTYAAAFEKGWTPGTLIWDVPSEFPPSGDPNDPRPPYKPVNYDGRFHGPVTVRSALANSYNVPAVKTLDFVGVFDNLNTPQEDGMIAFARRMGITSLTRSDYGLALTLGGGEVTLLEMAGAYAVFANGGRIIPPVGITRIVDSAGNLIFQYQPPPGEQVLRPEHAFMISSILSDNPARTPAFGPNSILNLPFTAAAKTGTTNDFRDNWTVGYTPDVVVGVWVGNADYTPMQNTSGLTGAAPIWANFMQTAVQALTGGSPSGFVKPAGVVERIICKVSGTEPSRWCPDQRSEFFAADQPPLPREEDLWQQVLFDTWTGLRISAACQDFTDEKFALNVMDVWAREWLKNTADGRDWAEQMGFSKPVFFVPDRECTADDPRPILAFNRPLNGETIIETPLEIFGQADATADFRRFRLEYGLGEDPVKWETLMGENSPVRQPDLIYSWDLEDIPEGEVTLRLYIESRNDTYAELRRLIRIRLPTPTPTPTETPTPTPTETPTPTPSRTPTMTFTPTISPTPTITPPPTTTPTVPTPTNTQTQVPILDPTTPSP